MLAGAWQIPTEAEWEYAARGRSLSHILGYRLEDGRANIKGRRRPVSVQSYPNGAKLGGAFNLAATSGMGIRLL